MSERNCPSTGSARDFLPAKIELSLLTEAAEKCRGCELYCNATQVVFGEGPLDATIMFIGEQPGDQEDKLGRPFVGPAGKLLDEAMQKVGIPREEVYVTNAVKHFKWTPRGKRRLHAKPGAREIAACRPWLEAEIQAIRPHVVVCLGATAAQTLMGSAFRVTKQRGEVIESRWAPALIATVHPSSLLRVPDAQARQAAREAFLQDLEVVAGQYRRLKRQAARRAVAEKRPTARVPGKEPGARPWNPYDQTPRQPTVYRGA